MKWGEDALRRLHEGDRDRSHKRGWPPGSANGGVHSDLKPRPGSLPFSTRTLSSSSFLNFVFGGSFNKTLIHGTERRTDESEDVPRAP